MAFQIINRPRLIAQFQFDPHDLWVGLFWRRTERAMHFYICLIPLVPLHIVIMRSQYHDGDDGEANLSSRGHRGS